MNPELPETEIFGLREYRCTFNLRDVIGPKATEFLKIMHNVSNWGSGWFKAMQPLSVLIESPCATSCVWRITCILPGTISKTVQIKFVKFSVLTGECLCLMRSFRVNLWIQDCEILPRETSNAILWCGVKHISISNHLGMDQECYTWTVRIFRWWVVCSLGIWMQR